MRIEARIPDAVLQRIRAPFRRPGAAGRKAERIDPPVIQPLDLLLDLSGEAMRERLFVVQGEDGAEACLRPDFTIPVARHLVEQGTLNDRWYYQGQAFRIAPLGAAPAIHPSEFLQIGIEAFGGPDDELADAEIATLAWESASAGGRDDLFLRIGDVSFFRAFLSDIGVPGIAAARLQRAFTRPNRLRAEIARARRLAQSPPAALSAADIERQWADQGLEQTGGRTAQEIADRLAHRAREATEPCLTDEQAVRIERYLEVSDRPAEALALIRALGAGSAFETESKWWSLLIGDLSGIPNDRISFDAGFGGPFSYYDGFVFEIVSKALGSDAAVAAGGRYDALAAQLLGRPVAAAGCMVRPARAWNGAAQ
jgi:ATP phosphoribosyltransferase regulatory subunit